MPVILEAILVSAGMLLIFAIAFFFVFLLAVVMSPVEKSLSKMIWDRAKNRKSLPSPPRGPLKGSFREFSKKH